MTLVADIDTLAPVSIETLDDTGAADWDRFVEACPEGTFFHRAGWKRVIERSYGHCCHFLQARSNGEIIGVLPLVHVKTRLFGNSLISTGFTVGGGPIYSRPEALEALDRHVLALAERLNVDYVEYRGRVPLHDDWAKKPGLYVGFRREIDPDAERNLRAVPRKQRAMVRKGIKAGLKSRIDRDCVDLHRIYAVSVRNLGTPVPPRRYFETLLDVFRDDADVITVVDDGVPVASVMSFYFRDQALPYFGGGTTAARPLAANDFMYWEVMRRACERGFQVFDFGRSKVGTGAFAFKKHWGFEPEPWTYEYILRRGNEVPEISPLNPKYRLAIAAWKKLPLAVANTVGPFLARGLG